MRGEERGKGRVWVSEGREMFMSEGVRNKKG